MQLLYNETNYYTMRQTKKAQPKKVKNGKNKTLKRKKNKTLKRTSKPKQTKGGNIIRQMRINRLEDKYTKNKASEIDIQKLINLKADTSLNEINTHIKEIKNDKKKAIEWFIRFIGEWYNIGDIWHNMSGLKEKSRLNNADGTFFCIFEYTNDVYNDDNRDKVIEDFEKISSPGDKWEVWTDDHINIFKENIYDYISLNSIYGLTLMHTNGTNWIEKTIDNDNWIEKTIDKFNSFTLPIIYTTEQIIEKIRNGELEKDTIITRPNSSWDLAFMKDKCKSYEENKKKFLGYSYMHIGSIITGPEYFESHKEKRDKYGTGNISTLSGMTKFNPDKLKKYFYLDPTSEISETVSNDLERRRSK